MKNLKAGTIVRIFSGAVKAVVLEVSEDKAVIFKLGEFPEYIVCSSPQLENDILSWSCGSYSKNHPTV